MANYPTSLDTFPNPTATTKEDAATFYHDVGHSDLGDAVEGLEAKVGVDSSTVTSSLDYRMRNLEYPSATGGEDDDFNDGSFTGWTTVEGAEALTVTEERGRASMVHPGGGIAGRFACRVKAHTFATNDWCQTAVKWAGRDQSFNMFGLVMTNGTTHGTSNGHLWTLDPAQATMRRQGSNGLNADTNASTYTFAQTPGQGEVHIRWRYEGANTFRGYVSPDGTSWVDFTGAVSSYTLTPTHWGFGLTAWTGTLPYVASFAYFKTGNG